MTARAFDGESGSFAMPLVRRKNRRPVLELVPDADVELAPERCDEDRITLEVDIGYQSDTNFFTGFGDDLSEGGLFVATYRPLPIGTEVTLSFVLPGGPQVTVRGRVSWILDSQTSDDGAHPGMGVAFTDVEPDALSAIRRYAQLRSPLFYDD